MIRRTSIEVYNKIMSEGLLSQLRFEVYQTLYFHGPLTAGECWNQFFKNTRQRSSISARMSELLERDVVFIAGERPCGYTGNLSIAWDVTDRLPKEIKKVKKLTYKELELENLKLKEIISGLLSKEGM